MELVLSTVRHKKKKSNTKITIESEVVAVSEYMPYIIHVINSFLGQGYTLHKNVLYQDNEGVIKMENNVRNSYTVNLRHTSIRIVLLKIVGMQRSLVLGTEKVSNARQVLH